MSYTVVVCAHNEEKYIRQALNSIFSQTLKAEKVIVVIDRCTDKTEDIVREFPVEIIIKNVKNWNYSYAENLELARPRVNSEFYAIVDADVVLEPNYFKVLLSEIKENCFCIGGKVVTKSNTLLGKLLYLWEKTYHFSPSRRPRGCALLIRKSILDKINGFADVPAPDTYIQDEALKFGYSVMITGKVKAYHIREITLRRAVKTQFSTGVARYIQGKSLLRTFLHSIIRLRPFVLIGYIYGILTHKKSQTRPFSKA
ncbi:MAG: glycosyltransferase family 2 protein [Candidatus Methanomethylicaceae archaeon]